MLLCVIIQISKKKIIIIIHILFIFLLFLSITNNNKIRNKSDFDDLIDYSPF
jgi:hypothetical protein